MKQALLLVTGFITTVIFMAVTACNAMVITKVTIRNTRFEPLRTLKSPEEVQRFKWLFERRKKVKPPEGLKWIYKLDIEGKEGRSTRWLYDPSGWLMVLTKANTPVYTLESPDEFRKLLLD